MPKTLPIYLLAVMLSLFLASPAQANKLDAPDEPAAAPTRPGPASYSQALAIWSSIAEINQWIGEHFKYDMERAMKLSETQRKISPPLPIMRPADFFNSPRGVCVDLARFGVETARHLAPGTRPAYLMIEFEPVQVQGNLLRRHWLTVFQEHGAFFSFADSKRPGHIAGPYTSLDELVKDYEKFRGRRVVSHKVLQDYRKKKKQKRLRKKKRKSSDWGPVLPAN